MRKPFFGIDITEDKKKASFNSDEHITKSAGESTAKRFEEKSEELDGKIAQYNLPTYLKIVKCLGLMCAAMIVSVLLEEDMTLGIAYKNAPVLITVLWIVSVAGAFLFLYEIKKRRNMASDPSVTEAVNEAKRATTEIFDELGVPTYAHETDILLFRYKVKDGKVKPVASGMMPTPYVNAWAKVFSENGYLSIANVEGRYDIPLEEITGISKVKNENEYFRLPQRFPVQIRILDAENYNFTLGGSAYVELEIPSRPIRQFFWELFLK